MFYNIVHNIFLILTSEVMPFFVRENHFNKMISL